MLVKLAGQGPTALDEEKEHLARQEEIDLQAGLAPFREEAHCLGLIVVSLSTSVEPAPSGLTPSFAPVVDVEGNITSLVPTFEREPSKALSQEDNEVGVTKEQGPVLYRCVDLGDVGAPMRRGVLGFTLGEASSCPTNDQLFHRPFDMEARALKFMDDLLPVQLRRIRECHGLGLAPSLDKEG
ncbi:hypothetical protein ACLOJK_007221 [Asimina triloba]